MTGTNGVRRVAVVGGSLAGLSTARALRSRGYAGDLVVISEEPYRPYDRPPLSKEFLSSVSRFEDLTLESADEHLGAVWLLGVRAVRLTPKPGGGAAIETGGLRTIEADAVVLATGASARGGLPGTKLPGVHLLRTIDHAVDLRADLRAAARDLRPVVAVGGGFVGSEVAATARELGCEVTLVVAEDAPLQAALGPFAFAITALHEKHGVTVRPNSRVVAVEDRAGVQGADEPGERLSVVVADGDHLPAATVVLGLGAAPATGWLAGSGVELDPDGGVLCDAAGSTSVPGVYAVGDCASWWAPALGSHRRVEHWTAAKERGAVVASALLGDERPPGTRASYVWSDLYGRRLQIAGERSLADGDAEIECGSLETGKFAAVYRRGGNPVAVVGVDHVRHVTGVRRRIVYPDPPSTESAFPSTRLSEGAS